MFVCPTEHMQAGSGVERSKDSEEHLPCSTQLLLVSCTPGAFGSSNWDWGIGEDGPSVDRGHIVVATELITFMRKGSLLERN